jgi:hypothetical protein
VSGIRTLGELKAALSSPTHVGAAPDIDMPALISSLNWSACLTPHFQVHCHDDRHGDRSFGAPLADRFERIYGELATFLSLTPRSKQERLIVAGPLICFIIRTRSERTFGSMEAPGPLFYLMDPEQDPDFMLRFRHEIAHLMWGRLYGEAPALFNEGLAVLAENMSVPGASLEALLSLDPAVAGEVPPLEEVAFNESFWRFSKCGFPLYRVGGALTHYLVQRWGWERLRDLFLVSEYEDPGILSHFRSIYGQELGAVDADLREYLVSWKG